MDLKLDLLVILDRSGSMQSAKTDHEGGLRSFIEDQRSLDGDVRFTLVQFDDKQPCEVVYDRTPIADVKDVVLIPRGGTPLLDAVGLGVSHLRAKIMGTNLNSTDVEPSVVCLVITDGEENSSREWTKARVKALVTELEGRNWSFLFLGANVDAFTEAHALGVSSAVALGYSNTGDDGAVGAMYAATSSNLMRARRTVASAGMRSMSISNSVVKDALSYTDEQRIAASGRKHGTVSGGGDSSADKKAAGRGRSGGDHRGPADRSHGQR